MTADTTQTESDDDTPAVCTICGVAVDTADRWKARAARALARRLEVRT